MVEIVPPNSEHVPLSFFSPHCAYSSRKGALGPITEFRDMVKALHRAGIEVILDVVFNHTTEGNENGPTLSYRGFDNEAYYMLAPNPAEYMNFSGCGNTLNSNHPIARRLILDLSGLAFMDSTGMQVLLGPRTVLSVRGGTLVLVSPQPVVARILELTGADQLIPVYATVSEAQTAD